MPKGSRSDVAAITVARSGARLGHHHGVGVFKPKERPQREGRNPRDGSTMTIAASTSVGFSAGAGLKSALKGGNGDGVVIGNS